MLTSYFIVILSLLSQPSLASREFPLSLRGLSASQKAGDLNESCRAQIKKAVCLVDELKDGEKPQSRPCLEGSLAYAAPFEALHDHYPPTLQKMFCSLKRIYIEKKFEGTAFADAFTDAQGRPVGAAIGIRKSVLDENLRLPAWASWKEQLSFGGATDSYQVSPSLPLIQTRSRSRVNDFLYFVIAHEIGHIFDFANQLNKVKNCAPGEGNPERECEMHEDSWGALSWLTNQRPKPANDFPLRGSLCFYWCKGQALSAAQVPEAYRDLARTDFLSTYATRQPWDDFADSLAYYLMDKYLGAEYRIDTRQGEVYDIMAKVRSPLFAKKAEYLENFLRRTDIFYP